MRTRQATVEGHQNHQLQQDHWWRSAQYILPQQHMRTLLYCTQCERGPGYQGECKNYHMKERTRFLKGILQKYL